MLDGQQIPTSQYMIAIVIEEFHNQDSISIPDPNIDSLLQNIEINIFTIASTPEPSLIPIQSFSSSLSLLWLVLFSSNQSSNNLDSLLHSIIQYFNQSICYRTSKK